MTTAFVLSGGGSLGAVQVGMLQALAEHDVHPDLLIGTSAGAINSAYLAGHGTDAKAIADLGSLWRGLRRNQVFPLDPVRLFGALGGRSSALFTNHGLIRVIRANLNYTNLEDAMIPVHIVATDLLSGQEVLLSKGDAVQAVIASAAIPGVYPAVTNTSQAATDQVGPGTPGMSGIHTGMTNTKNTPIEALERAFPLRVRKMRLRRGSGGAGSAPGGEGIEREIEVLEPCTVTLITERRVSQPWGLAGGEPGAVGENWLLPGGDKGRAERLPDKCTIEVAAGDVLRMLTPGGGGWGPPTG